MREGSVRCDNSGNRDSQADVIFLLWGQSFLSYLPHQELPVCSAKLPLPGFPSGFAGKTPGCWTSAHMGFLCQERSSSLTLSHTNKVLSSLQQTDWVLIPILHHSLSARCFSGLMCRKRKIFLLIWNFPCAPEDSISLSCGQFLWDEENREKL